MFFTKGMEWWSEVREYWSDGQERNSPDRETGAPEAGNESVGIKLAGEVAAPLAQPALLFWGA